MSPAAPLPPFAVVLVMAGSGTRFGGDVPKVFVPLAGRPLWRHAASVLSSLPGCVTTVLVTAAERVSEVRAAAADLRATVVVAGGARRQDSVRLGLAAVPEGVEIVAVHDAARPLVDRDVALRVIRGAAEHGAALAAVPARDTIKQVEADGRVVGTLDRRRLWIAQTPQAFRLELLRRAHEEAGRRGLNVTDDAALVEELGHPVHVSQGHPWNQKVTEAADLHVAEALLLARRAVEETA